LSDALGGTANESTDAAASYLSVIAPFGSFLPKGQARENCLVAGGCSSNAEITVFPWKDPPELKARTINRVRTFLKAHQTV
jgi:hypothetical protein